MVYANPGSEGAIVQFKPQYENYIGGQWVAPVDGTYYVAAGDPNDYGVGSYAMMVTSDLEVLLG